MFERVCRQVPNPTSVLQNVPVIVLINHPDNKVLLL